MVYLNFRVESYVAALEHGTFQRLRDTKRYTLKA